MRPFLLLVPLIGLSACVSPQQSCVSQVSRDLNAVNLLIDQSTANLQRGYAVETKQVLDTYPRMCGDDDGNWGWDFCDAVTVQNIHVPVAIDLQEEAKKLEQLKARRAKLLPVTESALAQCVSTYPE
jgi:hypothetical protein